MKPERKVFIKKCLSCNGLGYAVKNINKSCRICSQNGWVENNRDIKLCSKCNGEGKILGSKKITCKSCAGRGGEPRIVEFTGCISSYCPKCDGEGILKAWRCGSCIVNETYNDYDGVRCKICESKCICIETECSLCKGDFYKEIFCWRDIKTGEEFEDDENALWYNNDDPKGTCSICGEVGCLSDLSSCQDCDSYFCEKCRIVSTCKRCNECDETVCKSATCPTCHMRLCGDCLNDHSC